MQAGFSSEPLTRLPSCVAIGRRVGIHDLHFHDLRHTFATRLQRIGVDYEVRQALLGHRMPGMTANYSHGGPEWDRKLRSAVEGLEKAYPLSYGLSYETKAAVGGTPEGIDFDGESAGIRTQDPRLKRAGESEEKQQVDTEEPFNE